MHTQHGKDVLNPFDYYPNVNRFLLLPHKRVSGSGAGFGLRAVLGPPAGGRHKTGPSPSPLAALPPLRDALSRAAEPRAVAHPPPFHVTGWAANRSAGLLARGGGGAAQRALSRAVGGGGGGSQAGGSARDGPSPPLPDPDRARPCRHVGGEAQGRSEDRERPHQPEGGRAGRLRRAVQDQAAHASQQADEGLLRAAGFVHEADQIQIRRAAD